MATQIALGELVIDVTRKNIKNVHLSVYPPTGAVRISAPSRMSLDTIRLFAISKLGWIKKQQTKLAEQERESVREYVDRESHYVWGRRYLLKVVEVEAAPSVQIQHGTLLLCVRHGADTTTRESVVEAWYRHILRAEAAPTVEGWEQRLDVQVDRVFVQRMKTRWGSCNPKAGSIRLNTALALKPKECLEYVVVHEMAHLLEASHGPRFVALMDRFMPNWREQRERLNRLPARHEMWKCESSAEG